MMPAHGGRRFRGPRGQTFCGLLTDEAVHAKPASTLPANDRLADEIGQQANVDVGDLLCGLPTETSLEHGQLPQPGLFRLRDVAPTYLSVRPDRKTGQAFIVVA